ncbi:hypothetical protein Goshw_028087 [Gossypium schwendimanii]|uniref:Uncharacterized protein n=1 Tax=Gossypium schwendimanii TaxID=34291 RepID=A0A7J9N2Q1_GOSSC|nr:hypothetical protein [Gossypium schwendimanii]
MCSVALLQSMVFMLQILLKPLLAILDSCLMSMLRNSNPHLPLWLGVLMFRIIILLILICINTMLIVLILGEILMRVVIINAKVQLNVMSFHYWLVIFWQFKYRL